MPFGVTRTRILTPTLSDELRPQRAREQSPSARESTSNFGSSFLKGTEPLALRPFPKPPSSHSCHRGNGDVEMKVKNTPNLQNPPYLRSDIRRLICACSLDSSTSSWSDGKCNSGHTRCQIVARKCTG